ncbi:MAG: VWA domain-containing protein, partial [Opitutae bacterium]|nr:VWA domain-containing protein [Opitutae bacterium]
MNKTPVSTWIVPTLSILLLTLGCVSNKDKPDRHATNDQSTMEHLSISMGKPINPPQIPPSKPKPLRPPQQGKVTYFYQSQKKLYKPQPLRTHPVNPLLPALVTQLPALVTQYPDGNPVGEEYNHYPETSFRETLGNPLSTFSVDVDTASYSNCRRMLGEGGVPQPDAVRAEEFLNYFDYGFKPPRGDEPISIRYELARCPWNKQNDLLMVGLQTNRPNMAELPPSRLVFLVDTSGSMSYKEKLPLVKRSLRMLTQNLRAQDRVAIVTYAGNAGLALPSTAGTNKAVIMNAIESMDSGGFTAGAEGLKLAYDIATKQMDGKG